MKIEKCCRPQWNSHLNTGRAGVFSFPSHEQCEYSDKHRRPSLERTQLKWRPSLRLLVCAPFYFQVAELFISAADRLQLAGGEDDPPDPSRITIAPYPWLRKGQLIWHARCGSSAWRCSWLSLSLRVAAAVAGGTCSASISEFVWCSPASYPAARPDRSRSSTEWLRLVSCLGTRWSTGTRRPLRREKKEIGLTSQESINKEEIFFHFRQSCSIISRKIETAMCGWRKHI